ncbi:Zinc finger, CCHC-type [Corchorus capsularis]|uniref:Zinc finger, CCHC-type n=1 Tax=Corchorus capsularis TaxID=210143 RepID=A0A1R3JTB7_COCAP|nr:Zinc finger, CCHC-type [Corchorus capsularis]
MGDVHNDRELNLFETKMKMKKRYHRQNDKCYNCGKGGHFAWDCQFKQA